MSFPAAAAYKCAESKQIIPIILRQGYGVLSVAETPSGGAIMIFLDRMGNFKIIGIDENDMACELLAGSGWRFMLEGKA
jgi:hypothetical protein